MKIENLSKSFGSLVLFKDFNLDIKEGEITCILGKSGSGKTTLLNMIAGIENYQGQIDKIKPSYVFQEPRLIPNLTVEGNLSMVCSDAKKIQDILQSAQIADKQKNYPATLSGGQAQRVSLCRAFIYDGDVLLMDEPFSSLDLKLKITLMQTFAKMWRESKRTTIFVTHDVEEALCLAHRILILSDGKITSDIRLEGDVMREYGSPTPDRTKILSAILCD